MSIARASLLAFAVTAAFAGNYQTLWWLIIPVNYGIAYAILYMRVKKLSVLCAVALFWTLHLNPLALIIMVYGKGPIAPFLLLALILYCTIVGIIGLVMVRLLTVSLESCVALVVYAMSMSTLWWILETHLFIYFGDPFCSVLVPLAHYRQCIMSLPYFGHTGLTFLFFAHGACMVAWFEQKRAILGVFGLLCALPFIMYFIPGMPIANDSDYFGSYSVVAPKVVAVNPLECAQELCMQLAECITQNPTKTIIILPESSFAYPLNEFPALVQLLYQNIPLHNQLLIVGTHYKINTRLYNSACIIEECRIIYHYEKTFLLPFFEYIPQFFDGFTCLRNLFLENREEFAKAKDGKPYARGANSFFLRICAEFFFNTVQPPGDCPVIVLANELWIPPQFRHLLLKLVRLKAIEWQRPIIYAGHTQGYYIGSNGDQKSCFS